MSKYIKEEDACVRLWKKLRGLSDVIPMGKDAAGVAVRIIEDMPVADVVPVRHSAWKEVLAGMDYEYECTRCKACVEREYPYCPNCGAKMDGERKEK